MRVVSVAALGSGAGAAASGPGHREAGKKANGETISAVQVFGVLSSHLFAEAK